MCVEVIAWAWRLGTQLLEEWVSYINTPRWWDWFWIPVVAGLPTVGCLPSQFINNWCHGLSQPEFFCLREFTRCQCWCCRQHCWWINGWDCHLLKLMFLWNECAVIIAYDIMWKTRKQLKIIQDLNSMCYYLFIWFICFLFIIIILLHIILCFTSHYSINFSIHFFRDSVFISFIHLNSSLSLHSRFHLKHS